MDWYKGALHLKKKLQTKLQYTTHWWLSFDFPKDGQNMLEIGAATRYFNITSASFQLNYLNQTLDCIKRLSFVSMPKLKRTHGLDFSCSWVHAIPSRQK